MLYKLHLSSRRRCPPGGASHERVALHLAPSDALRPLRFRAAQGLGPPEASELAAGAVGVAAADSEAQRPEAAPLEGHQRGVQVDRIGLDGVPRWPTNSKTEPWASRCATWGRAVYASWARG